MRGPARRSSTLAEWNSFQLGRKLLQAGMKQYPLSSPRWPSDATLARARGVRSSFRVRNRFAIDIGDRFFAFSSLTPAAGGPHIPSSSHRLTCLHYMFRSSTPSSYPGTPTNRLPSSVLYALPTPPSLVTTFFINVT